MSAVQKTCWLVAAVALVCSGASCGSSTVKLSGTGATFPQPLYQKWFQEYSKAHEGVQINYQGNGSGQGVQSVIDNTCDFGASDVAMKPEEMEKVSGGVQLLPMTAGSIVLAYHVDDVPDLKLTRDAYVGIFLGKITKWDDPKIKESNPNAKLPSGKNSKITVVVRGEASGTTGVFTKHLSAISEEFKKKPGEGKKVEWSNDFLQGVGNPGVVANLTQTPNSIGYVEFEFGKEAEKDGKVRMAKLQNKAGEFVEASTASCKAALAAITLPENLIAWGPDPEGKDSYPIVTYTWVICYKHNKDAKKAKLLRDVLTWCVTDGQKSSDAMGYIPLPESVVAKVKEAIKNIGPADKG
ncbi:MAG: phosphate ABC transporter substrate-binding protein PstS [Thermoguttaceae bacterium]